MHSHIRHWEIGKARATLWVRGLPMPGHRTMAEIMAEEREIHIAKGALAFRRARKLDAKEVGDGKPRAPKL
jgi:hypothetical protein